MERHFGIECNNFDDASLREINQFVFVHPSIFTPLDSTNDGIHDKNSNHPLVADLDTKKLINIVKFDLRKGKAPGHDTIKHKLLRLAIQTPFYIHLAKLFTLSLRIGYIPTAWKLATLCMLIKPDKLPSLTASYRPIIYQSIPSLPPGNPLGFARSHFPGGWVFAHLFCLGVRGFESEKFSTVLKEKCRNFLFVSTKQEAACKSGVFENSIYLLYLL